MRIVQKHLNSESGVALLIILFIVLLVSLIGTAMLTTTTYGIQKSEKYKKEQEEFYRAEGALEIVLNEMVSYKDEDEGVSGPLAYLKDEVNSFPLVYRIGGTDIEVSISKISPSLSSIGSNITSQTITVTLDAKNKEHSEKTRSITFNIDATRSGITTIGNNTYNVVNYTSFIDGVKKNADVTKEHFGEVSEQYYDIVVGSLEEGKNISSGINSTFVKNGVYTFDPGVTRTPTIDLSGKNYEIIIPSDAIVYVKKIDLKGSGNGVQLVVNGLLIVDELLHGGNSNIILNSPILVGIGDPGTAAITIDTKSSNGISCSLLETACKEINKTIGSNKYSSTLDKSSVNFNSN